MLVPAILIAGLISLTILIIFVMMFVLALLVMCPILRSLPLAHLVVGIIRPVMLVILVVVIVVLR